MNDGQRHESFWDHLEALRGCLLRSIVALAVAIVVAFCLKDWLFSVVLAPSDHNFLTYRMVGAEAPDLRLINTLLTEQLLAHVEVAAYAGLMVAFPYVVWEFIRFVMPALYEGERRKVRGVALASVAMFWVGSLLSYFLLFPFTLKFLAGYSVSAEVEAMISLRSYVETMITMCLCVGIVAEMPVVCRLLASMGLVKSVWMRRLRKQAIVVILIASAIITPTTDAMTMAVVSVPIYGLYEISILIVRITEKKK